MSFPTRVQVIQRRTSEQWYVNLPSAVARALDFSKGETVNWTVHDRATLVLERPDAPASPLKKNRR